MEIYSGIRVYDRKSRNFYCLSYELNFFDLKYARDERVGETRNAYRILVGKPEGKRPLGRPRRSWVDNIKIDLREIGWDWYGLDRSGSG
jgi:hypothetical protein